MGVFCDVFVTPHFVRILVCAWFASFKLLLSTLTEGCDCTYVQRLSSLVVCFISTAISTATSKLGHPPHIAKTCMVSKPFCSCGKHFRITRKICLCSLCHKIHLIFLSGNCFCPELEIHTHKYPPLTSSPPSLSTAHHRPQSSNPSADMECWWSDLSNTLPTYCTVSSFTGSHT